MAVFYSQPNEPLANPALDIALPKDYVTKVFKQEVNDSRCQAIDSDTNGYVSCNCTTTGQPEIPRSIECAAWGLDGFLNRGCRTRVPTFETR